MDRVYNKHFFNEFYEENGGGNYTDEKLWSGFFASIAKNIVDNYNPKTVLDAGCATGYLVRELRKLGVDAYGIDISEYAIGLVPQELSQYFNAQSITDPLPESFPKKFDLVITIEVLEHLFPEDGMKAIKLLCSYSDTVVFTSTPDDIDDRTHCNVQLPEYWCREFAKNGFFHNVSREPDFICPWAMEFNRAENIDNVVFEYEINRRIDKARCEKKLEQSKFANGDLSIFFDTGKGFNETEKQIVSFSGERFQSQRIGVPSGCIAIRVDPVENAFCIAKNFSVVSNAGVINIAHTNAHFYDDSTNSYYFTNDDPQIYLDLSSHFVIWLEISFDIWVINDSAQLPFINGLTSNINDLIEKNNAIVAQNNAQVAALAQKNDELNSVIAEKTALISALAQKDNELAKLSFALSEKADRLSDLNCVLAENKTALEQFKVQRNELEAKILMLNTATNEMSAAIRSKDAHIEWHKNMLDATHNSFCWKVTAPIRGVSMLARRTLLGKLCISLKHNGVKGTIAKIRQRKNNKQKIKELNGDFEISAFLRSQQEGTSFNKDMTFSVLVPLYNTPEKFLTEMIDSVLDQTYKKWQLCLADGSDAQHGYVEKIVKKYIKDDKRICYKRLEKNGGISENTNECIKMATGNYIALFDHDDLLHPSALFEVAKAIEEQNADFVYTDENTFNDHPSDAYNPHFKPDYSPDTLRSYNYICHFSVFSKELLDNVGYFNKEYDGSQDYDIILRLTEKAKKVAHIPQILYYWRAHKNSVASDVGAKPYTVTAAKKALAAHLERVGLKGEVLDSKILTTYRIKYELNGSPLISIIIPTKDHIDDLKKCIDSIYEKTTYDNFEIIVIENNSTESRTFAYYEELKAAHKNISVVVWEKGFNYSAINNFGAKYAKGDYILLLNNDVEVITPEWLEEMLMYAQRSDVGAVGSMLYYPDDTIQHAGVILGIGGVAGHSHKYMSRSDHGYFARITLAQNLSCCTAACLMMSKKVYEEIGGLDENYAVAFNDVDLCMRIREKGYLIVFTPYCELYHYESKSRGLEDTPEKQKRFAGEVERFQKRWRKALDDGDPYYNPNLTLEREDFSYR